MIITVLHTTFVFNVMSPYTQQTNRFMNKKKKKMKSKHTTIQYLLLVHNLKCK